MTRPRLAPRPTIEVGTRLEERHRPDYPWPERRARGVVVEVTDTDVGISWDHVYDRPPHRRYRLDQIGDGMTDVMRIERGGSSVER